MAQIDDFFMYENRVEGITDADYQRVQPYVEAAQAFAQTTYQSIYIIDYYRKNFLYVSDNPLFLCGHTADEVHRMGYGFYLSHVPEDEVPMLTELNRSGFRAFYEEPVEIRRQCMMSYDFHIAHGNRQLLVNHKITPLAMTTEGRVWLALCTVSLSPHKEAGHIEFLQFHTGEKREYSLEAHRWKSREEIALILEEVVFRTRVADVDEMIWHAIAVHHVVGKVFSRADGHAAIHLSRVAAQDFRLLALPVQPRRHRRRQLRLSTGRRPYDCQHFLHHIDVFRPQSYKISRKRTKRKQFLFTKIQKTGTLSPLVGYSSPQTPEG